MFVGGGEIIEDIFKGTTIDSNFLPRHHLEDSPRTIILFRYIVVDFGGGGIFLKKDLCDDMEWVRDGKRERS